MFLDIPLAYELILVIALVAFIAWLTGRVFCKSKEHQAKTHNKSLESEKKYLVSGLTEKDNELQVLTSELRDYQQQVSDLTHQHDLDVDRVNVFKKEQKKVLTDLEKSNAYQIKLSQLNKQYEAQSKQLSSLLTTVSVDKEALQQNIEITKKQKRQLDEIVKEKNQLGKEKERLEKKLKQQLKQEKIHLKAKIEEIRTLQHAEEEKQHQFNVEIQKKINVINLLKEENSTLQQSYSEQQRENKQQQDNEQAQREALLSEKKALEKLNTEKMLTIAEQTKDIQSLKEALQKNENKLQKNSTSITQQKVNYLALKEQKNKIKKELKQTIEQEKTRLEEIINHKIDDMQEMQRENVKDRHEFNLTLQEKDHVIDVLQEDHNNIKKRYTEKVAENKKREANEKEQHALILNQKQLNLALKEEKKSFQNEDKLKQKKIALLEGVKTEKERLEAETKHQQKALVMLKKEYENKQIQYQQQGNKLIELKKQHAAETALKETLQHDKQDLASRYDQKMKEIEWLMMLKEQKEALEKEINTQNRLISKLRNEKKTLAHTNTQQTEEISAFNQERARQLALTNEKLSQLL